MGTKSREPPELDGRRQQNNRTQADNEALQRTYRLTANTEVDCLRCPMTMKVGIQINTYFIWQL